MLDYGALPPEINSTRMYAGPGSGPLIAAAAAWQVLANGLETASRGYASVLARLEGESCSGGASAAMATAAAQFVAWMANAAAQAEDAAGRARAAAAAYETALGATVPPALVTANRTLLAHLVASNVLGQNTALIGATEGAYFEMWAQDAGAMYGYAASSSGATTLRQFGQPPQTATAGGQSTQTAAVVHAAGGSAAGQSHAALSRAMSTVPLQLQTLSTTGTSDSSMSSSGSSSAVGRLSVPQSWAATNPAVTGVAEVDGGPSCHEGPATNRWRGAPVAATASTSGLLSRPRPTTRRE